MTDLEKARHLFQQAGLAFPTIPEELAAGLKEQGEWLFSTRQLEMSPYNLEHYVHEGDGAPGEDYAVLCHSGHGVNSYALQYYLVHGALRMFLHLAWGGMYMDTEQTAADIRDCFSLADKIVSAVKTVSPLQPSDRLLIVGSDFYGSYWCAPGKSRREADRPAEVLAGVLRWLNS